MEVLDDWLTWVPFVLGWLIGWALLARPRTLPAAAARTEMVTIVVPARDEAHALPDLLTSLVVQLGDADEVIVVDDGSSDETAAVAASLGARVIVADPPPDGWAGKPHACSVGAREATADVVVFVDADVTAGPDLLDRLAAAVCHDPDALVSVEPWHTPVRPVEQLGLFGNLVALMGVGRFSLLGTRSTRPVAFGPILAMRLDRYRALGGHGADTVRSAAIDDVALAQLVGRTDVYVGRDQASFRMYPGGWRDLSAGWTRVIAAGIGASPMWAATGAGLWLWALAAAPFIGWWASIAAIAQVALLSRIAGRFSPIAALLYPIALIAFVAFTIRSVWVRLTGRRVGWKDRPVTPG